MAKAEIWKKCPRCEQMVRPDENHCPLCRKRLKMEKRIEVRTITIDTSGKKTEGTL